MRASDVMVRDVVTVSPDTTVEALARLMINLRIGGVPVV
jgi:CBS domain-containing protein